MVITKLFLSLFVNNFFRFVKILRFPRNKITVSKQPRNNNKKNGPWSSALPFSDSCIPSLIFCCDYPGRRFIFPGTLKVRPKNSFLPILAPDDIFLDKTDLGVLRTFFVVNTHYKCFLYLENSGRRYILKWKYRHFWKLRSDWSANPRPPIWFSGKHFCSIIRTLKRICLFYF